MKSVITLAACLIAVPATAQTLDVLSTHALPSQLGSGLTTGLIPQGLGVDEAAGRLLYAQRGEPTVYSTAFDGSDLQVYANTGLNNIVSVSAIGGELFVADITNGDTGQDMWRMTPPNGALIPYGTSVSSYGGYPIDLRGGSLYRTNSSSSNSWAGLYRVLTFDANDPEITLQLFNIRDTNAIGDIAIDLDSNSVWILDYDAAARIHRLDLTTGAVLTTYQVVGDGFHAGLTYTNGKLYYYDWDVINPTLTVLSTGLVVPLTCVDGMDAVDLDEDGDNDSCIHPTADIGEYVTIEPGAHIHANAVIAPRAIIGNDAVIGAGAIVGRRAEVRGTLGAGVVLGRSASVLQESTVGDGTTIGYGSTIGNSDLGPNTTIGNLVSVFGSDVGDDGGLGLVVVARSATIQSTNVGSLTVVGPDSDLDTTNIGASVRIRKEATFAFGSVINDGARIGRNADIGSSATIVANARVGANAIVSNDSCPAGDVARGVTENTPCP